LIEVIASVSFAAIVLLGFAATTISVARATSVSRNATAATALAQQQLERLRGLPIGAVGLLPGSYQDPMNPIQADGQPDGIFERRWVVSARDVPELGLKTVIVTVAWTDQEPHQTTVAAYVRCSTVPCS
jgi:hypothetical protein